VKPDSHFDLPAWLKAMGNGALGEARALAFLLDRFWVLERSVDVQGADLIVQRPHMAAEMTVTARSIRLLPISPASRGTGYRGRDHR